MHIFFPNECPTIRAGDRRKRYIFFHETINAGRHVVSKHRHGLGAWNLWRVSWFGL